MSLRSVLRLSTRNLKRVDNFLYFVLGVLCSAIACTKPKTIIWSFVSLIVATLLAIVFVAIQRSRTRPVSPWEQALQAPTVAAVQATANSNESYFIVGSTIEIEPHPQLSTYADLPDKGWNPADVALVDHQSPFDDDGLLKHIGGVKQYDPPNGGKLCLFRVSPVTSDSPLLQLHFSRTNYFTVKTVQNALFLQSQLRHRFGSVIPSDNHVPHSFCLHYVVRFHNGDLLALQRSPGVTWYPNKWSISGEEQIKPEDARLGTLEQLFKRTFCEEVLALLDDDPATLDYRWNIASPLVSHMRLWSISLEEELFNFDAVGLFQLSVDRDEFLAEYTHLIRSGTGQRDKEGRLYVIPSQSLLDLLTDRWIMVSGFIDSGVKKPLHSHNFHPTSRYRLFRLVQAIYRRPLETVIRSHA